MLFGWPQIPRKFPHLVTVCVCGGRTLGSWLTDCFCLRKWSINWIFTNCFCLLSPHRLGALGKARQLNKSDTSFHKNRTSQQPPLEMGAKAHACICPQHPQAGSEMHHGTHHTVAAMEAPFCVHCGLVEVRVLVLQPFNYTVDLQKLVF